MIVEVTKLISIEIEFEFKIEIEFRRMNPLLISRLITFCKIL